jgi:signal transduction histidine kinase
MLQINFKKNTLFVSESYANDTEAASSLSSTSIMFPLWDSMSDGVLVIEPQTGNIVYMNTAATQILGVTGESSSAPTLINTRLCETPKAAEILVNLVQETGSAEFESNAIFDGHRLIGRMSHTLGPNQNQQHDELIILTMHVETGKEKIEHMRKHVNSVITHELRTPLTSIKGALDLLKSGAVGKMTEQGQSLLNIASSNSERMLDLIRDILDLNEIAQTDAALQNERIALAPLFERVISSHQGYGAYHGVEITSRPTEPNLNVYAPSKRVMQILSNLLSNAVKASDKGGRVELWATKDGHEAAIFVQDYGTGIADGIRDTLFDSFTKSNWKNAANIGSSGLGLNIVKLLVEQLHGTISFDTENDKGTIFRVALPLA